MTMIQQLISCVLFASFAMASEVTTQARGNAWKYGTSGGIIGFFILVLDIITIRTFSLSSFSPHGIRMYC
jgi:hypothetical protein